MNYSLLFLPVIFLIYACNAPAEQVDSEDIISIGVKETIYSEVLEEDREIWIYVPPDYYTMNQVNMVYPVVYLMDPTEQFESTVGILQQLSISNANNFCPPMIVVGIRHNDRSSDLPPRSKDQEYDTKGGADMVLEFIETEVMPFIDKTYPTAPHRVLIGHSLGGLFVFNALVKKPYLFANYVNIDPAMFWADGSFGNEVLDSLSSNQYEDKKLYLATANNYTSWITESTIDADTTEQAVMTKHSLNFGKALDALHLNSLPMKNVYYEDEIHGSLPGPATRDAFRWFYQNYQYEKMIEYYNPDYPDDGALVVADVEQHYAQLSKEMGYTVLPLESYINGYAFGLLHFGKQNIAKSLLDLNKKNYPESVHVQEALDYYENSL